MDMRLMVFLAGLAFIGGSAGSELIGAIPLVGGFLSSVLNLPTNVLVIVWFPSINGLILTDKNYYEAPYDKKFPSINGLILTSTSKYIVASLLFPSINGLILTYLYITFSITFLCFHPSMV